MKKKTATTKKKNERMNNYDNAQQQRYDIYNDMHGVKYYTFERQEPFFLCVPSARYTVDGRHH